jgi:hypothetical protein
MDTLLSFEINGMKFSRKRFLFRGYDTVFILSQNQYRYNERVNFVIPADRFSKNLSNITN